MTVPGRTATLVAALRTVLLAAGLSPVRLGPMLDDADRIALTPYPLDDDMHTGTVLQAVQVHVRGQATKGVKPVFDDQDQILEIIGNLEDVFVGGIHVTTSWRQISAPLAYDNGRPEVRDTYYLRTDRLGRAG